jgi:hypothetical protein
MTPSDRIQALPMMEAMHHESRGHFATLKRMADEERACLKENLGEQKSRRKVYPIVDRGQWVDVLLTLNFAKSKKRLLREFEKWLDKPENRKRLDAYKGQSIGTTGGGKDRLKDLAAWRLHRELGEVKAQLFINEHRLRNSNGQTRPFHDSREIKSEKLPANEAPLYSEHTGFAKAKARAKAYLVGLMPCEFDKEAEDEFWKAAIEAFEKDF